MTTDATERELQFAAPDLAEAKGWILAQPRHALLAFRLEGSKTQDDAYMDTDDWAIYRSGFAFRVRRRSEDGEVTLKALNRVGGALQERREISQPYSEFESGERAPGSPAAAVKLITNGRPLRTLFRVETLRTDFAILQDDRRLATLSLDDAKVIVGEEVARGLRRVEIEEAAPKGLTQLEPFVAALEQACHLTPVSQSKFEAGLEAAGLRPETALDFGYAALSPDATAGEYAYALLRGYFADCLRHEPGTRLGEDPEELHDMRVATRRLRAAISLFKPLLPLRFFAFRDELKWVGASLGAVRDLDVYLEWLEQERKHSTWMDGTALGVLIEDVEAARLTARASMLEAMGSERYAALVGAFAAALRAGDQGAGESARPIFDYAGDLLRKRYKQLRKDASGLEPSSDTSAYHEVRVAAKRLRYALDSFKEVFPRRVQRAIRATRDVQDLLGEHQDCAVSIGRLKSTIEEKGASFPPATVFRAGELTEQRRQRMVDLREAWPESYAELRASWRRFAKGLNAVAETKEDAQDGGGTVDAMKRVLPPVQRPLWLLQRFFGKRSADLES